MDWYIIAAISIAALLAAFITYVIVRAIMFKPHPVKAGSPEPVKVNTEKAVSDLAEMVRCKTVSHKDAALDDEGEFEKFEALLPRLFPALHKTCDFEKIGNRALLYRWRGKSDKSPTVLMAHYDVVSVVSENWERDPFGGEIVDGVLWGRGTLDTKGTLNGALQAAEQLISEGFTPKNDIYFAFGGDEEINGHGASDIVALFISRGITPGMVVDEGGAVIEGVFPGVKKPCALIGISEKGMINIEYSVTGGGGHASSPAPHTPIGKLSRACVRMEKNPFRFRLNAASRAMFDTLGRHSTFLYRVIFANINLFSPVLSLITKKSGGEFNAIVRTTTAFTQMEGSKGINVIPPYARMASNHRILAGESTESVLATVKKTVNDPDVQVRMLEGSEPSVVSRVDCEAWERIALATHETWQDAIVSPYPMVACSDSRHWGVISDKVYRFSAMALSGEERGTIHGNNERVPAETVRKTVEFYIRLIKQC